MPSSLATVTPNVPVLATSMLHSVRRLDGPNEVWMCDAHRSGCGRYQKPVRSCTCGRCGFTGTLREALLHTAENQWIASPNLPRELQLTPEQEAA